MLAKMEIKSEVIDMDSNSVPVAEAVGCAKKYAVIVFLDDNSVEIIPCRWIISEVEAMWPPPTTTTSTLQRLIKDCAEPKLSWKAFQIKIYSKTNSYFRATRQLNMARDLSCMSSGSSSESDSELIQPRMMTQTDQLQLQLANEPQVLLAIEPQVQLAIEPQLQMANQPRLQLGNQPQIHAINRSQVHLPEAQKRKRKIPVRYTDYSLDSSDSIDSPSLESQSSSSDSISASEIMLKHVAKKYNITPSLSTSDLSCAKKTKKRNHDEMFEIKSLMYKVLNLQKKSYEKLKAVEKRYDKLEEELNSLKNLPSERSILSTIVTLPTLPKNLTLPIQSDSDLQLLNEEIGGNANLRSKLIRFFLQAASGRNESVFLYAFMKALLTKDVAMMYTRLGRKGKKSFASLYSLNDVVLTVTSLKFPNTAPERIAVILGKVLANSNDWYGRGKSGVDSNHTSCMEP